MSENNRNKFTLQTSDDPYVKYQKYIAMGSAVFLFVFFCVQKLDKFSSLTDSAIKGIDYFTLPRCGLAILNGTNVFTSTLDYQSYGPWGSNYTSHPLLCFVLGVPLSKLSPWVGFWMMNICYLALHLVILNVFFSRSKKTNFSSTDRFVETMVAVASGLFMPWYTMYNQGQYHALAVCGLFLILAWPQKLHMQVGGLLLSAFAKPVLAPLAIVLLFARSWSLYRIKILIYTSVLVVLGSLPFAIEWTLLLTNFQIKLTESFEYYLSNGSDYMRFAIWRWNQQQSLATVLDEFMAPDASLAVRYVLTGIIIVSALFLASVKNKRIGVHSKFSDFSTEGQITIAMGLCSSWYFLMYARGHEYQWTLFLPLILALYFEASGRYRNAWMASLLLLTALPNGYFIFHLIYDFEGVDALSSSKMVELSPLLYAFFIVPKPLCAFLVSATVIKTELQFYFCPKCSQNLRFDGM